MKLAGSRAPVFATVLVALLFAPLFVSCVGAEDLQRDDLEVAAGAYFREDMVVPADGGVWQATVIVLDGGGPVDVYVMPTTDLLLGYPAAQFAPIEGRQNVTYASISWRPPDRRAAYCLIVDNLDNGRADDAVPVGPVTVRLIRTPPLRANPEAAAALSAGTTLCAALLGLCAVGVAVHLKRRSPGPTDEEPPDRAPRFEVPVEIPQRPRGSWDGQGEDGSP